jgi:hypothetical protein
MSAIGRARGGEEFDLAMPPLKVKILKGIETSLLREHFGISTPSHQQNKHSKRYFDITLHTASLNFYFIKIGFLALISEPTGGKLNIY